FAQAARIQTAVVTAAVANLATDTPTGTIAVLTAGPEGCIVTRVMAIPRATTNGTSLVLLLKKAGQPAIRLIDSELMAAATVNTTTAIPETVFGNISDSTPLRLDAGDELHVGSQVALASGIVFAAQWMDY
ncbi:hypothetical protein, partial [Stutzerimonas stutzeri]|uniref:hypothetical protein n=1 Tax=Stutzerimonas stutzeri TaxID=316 RepID=UPI00244BAD64